MIAEEWILIYMDNILIYLEDLAAYEERMWRILTWLKEKNLFLKPEKYVFEIEMVDFLELVISPRYIYMDPVKGEEDSYMAYSYKHLRGLSFPWI